MHKSNIIIKQTPPVKYVDSSILRKVMDKITEEEQKEQITFNNTLIENKEIVSISYEINIDMIEKDQSIKRIIQWANGILTNDYL